MCTPTRKNKSIVWATFENLQSGKAKCKLCCKEIVSVGGSTSGMNAHLRSMHSEIGKAAESSQPKLPSFSIGANRPCPDRWQEILTDMLLDIMSENLLPMVFIKSSSLLRFLKFVEPDFKPPCRHTTTHLLLVKKTLWPPGSRTT